jgi:hypothetical protein
MLGYEITKVYHTKCREQKLCGSDPVKNKKTELHIKGIIFVI